MHLYLLIRIDLHMFGGFQDDRQLSAQITDGILCKLKSEFQFLQSFFVSFFLNYHHSFSASFHSNSAKINLRTFCVTGKDGICGIRQFLFIKMLNLFSFIS